VINIIPGTKIRLYFYGIHRMFMNLQRLLLTINIELIQLTAAAYLNKMKASQIGGFCLLNLCVELEEKHFLAA
jgi:hypothetical protein